MATGVGAGGQRTRSGGRRFARRWVALVGVAALAVGASGCSSTDDPGSGTPASGSSPAPSGSTAPAPSTAPDPALDGEGEAYADAIATLDPNLLGEPGATCLARVWVAAIGVPAFEAAGITPDGLLAGEQLITDLTIDEALAGALVDGFEACGTDAKQLIVDEAAGRQVRDESVATCLGDRLTDEAARTAWIESLTTGESPTFDDVAKACPPTRPPVVTGLTVPNG